MSVGRPDGAPAPGDLGRFGKYSLVARLAAGGMAEVFLARYTGVAGFERDVVIKRILPHHARDERYVTMFLAEARIAARLSHPNVAHVYELGEVDGHYYMAMEYLEGVTFDTLGRRMKLEQKPADVRLIAGLIVQACEGLHHAHDLHDPQGRPTEVVHRDVSPHNLFVTTAGILKVLDFGVAKAHWATPRTDAGVVKGTYSYMSPEQLRGEKLDRRTDVFGLGIVLFELITLKRLFHRETDYLIFNAITTEDIPRVGDVREGVPEDLAGVIARALSRNRNDRVSSARELGLLVTRAVESLGGPLLPGAIAKEIQRLCQDDLEELRSVIAAGGRPLEPPDDTTGGSEFQEEPTVRPGAFALKRPSHPPIATTEEKPTVAAKTRSADTATDKTSPIDDVEDSMAGPTVSEEPANPPRAVLPPKKALPSPLTAVGVPPPPRQEVVKIVDDEQSTDTTTRVMAAKDDETPTAAKAVDDDKPFTTSDVPEEPYEGPTALDHDPSDADSETGLTLPGAPGGLEAYRPDPPQEKTVPQNPLLGVPPPAPPLSPGPAFRVPTAQIPMNQKLAYIPPPGRGAVPDLRPSGLRSAKLAGAFMLSAGVGIAILLAVRHLVKVDRAPPQAKPVVQAPAVAPPAPPAPSPVPSARPSAAPVAAPPPPLPAPEPSPPPSRPSAKTPEPRFPKATKRSGFLTVDGDPGEIVVVDGRRAGSAPIKRYPLDPGRHDVVIEVDRGKPKHFKVNIKTSKEVLVRVP